MTFQQELSSWWTPNGPRASSPPSIGSPAPSTPQLGLQRGRAAVITFLRHCGCPFAEKTYLNLREVARENSEIDFIAVSHSSVEHTEKWLKSLPQAGSEGRNVRTVVDEGSEVYAAWGVGVAGWAHVLSPFSLWEVYKVGRDEGIKNRPTESGSRWQMSGSYAVDAEGIVRWGRPMNRADEIPSFEEAVEKVKGEGKKSAKL